MWSKSKKRIAELEHQLDLCRTQSEAKLTQLVRDLREMDQLVYQMVQTVEPSIMRSAVQRAWAITESRMQAESKRIQAVLIPEIIKTYADPSDPRQAKLLENKQ